MTRRATTHLLGALLVPALLVLFAPRGAAGAVDRVTAALGRRRPPPGGPVENERTVQAEEVVP